MHNKKQEITLKRFFFSGKWIKIQNQEQYRQQENKKLKRIIRGMSTRTIKQIK